MRSGDQYEVPVGRSLLGLVCAAVILWLGSLMLAGCGKIPPINPPTPPTPPPPLTCKAPELLSQDGKVCVPPAPLCDASLSRSCWHMESVEAWWLWRGRDGVTDYADPSKEPAVTLPDPQPYLDDAKLTDPCDPKDCPAKYLDLVSNAVRLYQQKEPSHWNGGRWAVPIATALPRLSAYLRPVVAAQSISATGQVSDAIFVCSELLRCEEWHVYGPNGGWANTTGAMKGVWNYGVPQVPQPTPPDPLAKLAPLPPRNAIRIDGKIENKRATYTPKVIGQPDLCLAWGYTDGRANCAMGADLSPERIGREHYALGDDTGSTDVTSGPSVCIGTGGKAFVLDTNWLECSAEHGTTAIQLCGTGAQASVCSKPVPTGVQQ